MKTGTYMDLVSVHYDDFKKTFASRDNNRGRRFDEDSFNDAFIKCANRFGNNVITYDDALRYFWIAYSNTAKSIKHNDIELDDTMYDIIDDEDPSKANYIYNIVMAAITEAFNEDDMMIYSLYKYHGWSEKELVEAGYDCKNLDVRIKTIHKFVKAYCKKHF
jgi:hypothetical protein